MEELIREIRPVRVGREKFPVLLTDPAGMDMLHRANGMCGGREIPGITFTAPQAEEVLRFVNAELRKCRALGRADLATALSTAREAIEENRVQAKGRPMIALQCRLSAAEQSRTLTEELDHAAQIEATGDIYAHHLGPEGMEQFLASPAGQKADAVLLRTYPDAPPSHRVLEIGVRLMRPGRFIELNLTPDEAIQLRGLYADLLIRRHGPERVIRLLQKITFATERESDGNEASDRIGLRRRRRDGKAPDLAEAVRGCGRVSSAHAGAECAA